jgi:hypothetical protein
MINLESFDQYRVTGRFDPVAGVIDKASRAELDVGSFAGHFGNLGGREIVFCRLRGCLYVFEGSSAWLASVQTVSWLPGDDKCVLKVASEVEIPLIVKYDSPGISLEDDYVTSFSSPEDWDFGRYISSVVSDPDRAQRRYR